MRICETRIEQMISQPGVGCHEISETAKRYRIERGIVQFIVEVEQTDKAIVRKLYSSEGLLEVDIVSLVSGKVETMNGKTYENRMRKEQEARFRNDNAYRIKRLAAVEKELAIVDNDMIKLAKLREKIIEEKESLENQLAAERGGPK